MNPVAKWISEVIFCEAEKQESSNGQFCFEWVDYSIRQKQCEEQELLLGSENFQRQR